MTLTPEQIKNIIKEKVTGQVKPAHDAFGHHYQDVKSGNIYDSVTTLNGILENPHLKKWSARLAIEYVDSKLSILSDCNEKEKEEIYHAAIMNHVDIFEDAGTTGNFIHEICDNYIKLWLKTGKQPEDITKLIIGEDSRLWAGTRSFESFCKDFRIKPIASELLVISNRHKYAGTLDDLMLVPRVVKNREGDKNCEHQWMISPINNNIEKCFKCDRKELFELTLLDIKTSNSINKPEYAMQTEAYARAFHEMTSIRCKNILILRLDKKKCKYEILKVNDRPNAFKAFKNSAKIYNWLNNKKAKLVSRVAKARISIDDL